METFTDSVKAGNRLATPAAGRSQVGWVRGTRMGLWVVAICATLACPLAVLAEIDPVTSAQSKELPANPTGGNPPKVELGRLLRLPDSYHQPSGTRRGVKRSEWENRFEVVRLDLSSAEKALAKAQSDLGEAADDSSSWSVAAPGATPNPENTPLSYKLRQEIRRQRESIERAERSLRSLDIEADLANVPPQWRAPDLASQPIN